uniref:AlNc14C168G7949 protein n=1 Tax=Albugo laibachii Nc14 TaxID=890382 RepID=F0WNB8_9STRA|nr:AlNc14C168G7949 [Albugo laibachii Nc14]|eukprot:CCA22808.1 AlNc14C168G7949 [Albugo laibachii Nc14]
MCRYGAITHCFGTAKRRWSVRLNGVNTFINMALSVSPCYHPRWFRATLVINEDQLAHKPLSTDQRSRCIWSDRREVFCPTRFTICYNDLNWRADIRLTSCQTIEGTFDVTGTTGIGQSGRDPARFALPTVLKWETFET